MKHTPTEEEMRLSRLIEPPENFGEPVLTQGREHF